MLNDIINSFCITTEGLNLVKDMTAGQLTGLFCSALVKKINGTTEQMQNGSISYPQCCFGVLECWLFNRTSAIWLDSTSAAAAVAEEEAWMGERALECMQV